MGQAWVPKMRRSAATFCGHDFILGSGVHRGVEAYIAAERPARYTPVHSPYNANFCLASCTAGGSRNPELAAADEAGSRPVFSLPPGYPGQQQVALCESQS